jgi:hypothetical protein
MIARVATVPAIGFTSTQTIAIRDKVRRRRSPGREGREPSMPTINRGTANQTRGATPLFYNQNSGEPQ